MNVFLKIKQLINILMYSFIFWDHVCHNSSFCSSSGLVYGNSAVISSYLNCSGVATPPVTSACPNVYVKFLSLSYFPSSTYPVESFT